MILHNTGWAELWRRWAKRVALAGSGWGKDGEGAEPGGPGAVGELAWDPVLEDVVEEIQEPEGVSDPS